ncbi:hypothetical protein Pint_06113 [Pistacia integerrima]|uniref:Uncharacterized protein n=1 Tax=Pistacia integerrima TaxID=434235 RepID=A0ACC0Z709_9ROSI|nr:hypothetical protein Pint_06113 [Pistacia integerrima]
MSSEILQAAKVYRHLLKAVGKHIGKEDYKNHFREYITQEFRKNSNLSDPSSIQQKIRLAHDYTFLLNSVHHQKARLSSIDLIFTVLSSILKAIDLLFSYNIAVDRSDEMKRVLGKSAASVGLRLPEPYQP